MVVRRRSRVNPLLAATGYWWAFGALTRSVGARAHYDRRREAGDRHASALRHLYARMLGQLHYCLREQVHYREDRAYPT